MARTANSRVQVARRVIGSDKTDGAPNSESARRLKQWRMNLVAQLVLAGNMTLEDIREYLLDVHDYVVSGGQLSKDIKQMQERWQKQSIESTDKMCRAELNKLSTLEDTAIQGLRDTGKIDKFAEIMLKISKRRSSLLGLDKAKKLEVIRGLESLSDEELEATVRDGEEGGEPDADV